MTRLRLGTRASRLALTQTGWVRDRLREAHSDLDVELVQITTGGDRDRATALAALAGVGLFTKELEQALLDGRCDLAVHSLKDLPVLLAPGFALAAVPRRADPADVILVRAARDDDAHDRASQDPSATSDVGPASLEFLPPGAKVGTGSPRRKALLRAARPDLDLVPLRGNVDTRAGKVLSGELDAVVLAAAGLDRLAMGDGPVPWADRGGQRATLVRHRLDPTIFCPAPAQGALGLECRAGDDATLALAAALDHGPTRRAAEAERALLAGLGGGCSLPVGAYAVEDGDRLSLIAVVADPEGHGLVRDRWQGPPEAAEAGARELAEWLRASGADTILGRLHEP